MPDNGQVERPFSYIRQDFFLGRSFRDLDDLDLQLMDWLDTVANVRVHGTTQRVVAEAFAAEQPELQTLPEHRFDAALKLERRVSHDGFVAVGGYFYSVPDRTRRVVEIQQLPDVIRILELAASSRSTLSSKAASSIASIAATAPAAAAPQAAPASPPASRSVASAIMSRCARSPSTRRSAASSRREVGHDAAGRLGTGRQHPPQPCR